MVGCSFVSDNLTLTPKVEFRLVVFRPFKGEILLGRISSASELGMKSMTVLLAPRLSLLICSAVSLDFFDDILVPPSLMFPNSYLYVASSPIRWYEKLSAFRYVLFRNCAVIDLQNTAVTYKSKSGPGRMRETSISMISSTLSVYGWRMSTGTTYHLWPLQSG